MSTRVICGLSVKKHMPSVSTVFTLCKLETVETIFSLIEKRATINGMVIPKATKDISSPNARTRGPRLSSSKAVVIMIGRIGRVLVLLFSLRVLWFLES